MKHNELVPRMEKRLDDLEEQLDSMHRAPSNIARITALEAENKRLREALKHLIPQFMVYYMGNPSDGGKVSIEVTWATYAAPSRG